MALLHVDKYFSVPDALFQDNYERFFYVGYYVGTSFRVAYVGTSYDAAVKFRNSQPVQTDPFKKCVAPYVILQLSVNLSKVFE